jgi:hypothetical protein
MAGSGFRVNNVEIAPGASVEVTQTDAAQLEVTVNQDTPAQCQVEPVQTNPAELEVTINQGTASEAKVEPVQTDPTQLVSNTYSIGYDIRSDFSSAPTNVSVTTSTARSAQLAVGLYEITTDADCFFLQGSVTVDALTTSHPLWANTYRLVYVSDTTTKGYIAAITASGTATLRISKIG